MECYTTFKVFQSPLAFCELLSHVKKNCFVNVCFVFFLLLMIFLVSFIRCKAKSCCNGVLHHFLRVRWLWMNRKTIGEAIYVRVSDGKYNPIVMKRGNVPTQSFFIVLFISLYLVLYSIVLFGPRFLCHPTAFCS
jgi:hypothetical protein